MGPTSGLGRWARSPAHISPCRTGCLSRAGPCSWHWLVLRMFAFSVDTFFSLSLFCGCNIDIPERRESIRAQGRVCAGPSVASIYIVGLTAQPLAPASRGWPSEDQLCGSRVADTELLCVLGRHTLPPLKPLLRRTPHRQHRGAVRLWAGWRDAGTSGGHSGAPLNPLLSATSLLTTGAVVRL